MLGVALDTDPIRLERLGHLYDFRNVLAHANGHVPWLTRGKAKALQGVLLKYPTNRLEHDYLILSPVYVRAALVDVEGSASDLVSRVRGRGPRVEVLGET